MQARIRKLLVIPAMLAPALAIPAAPLSRRMIQQTTAECSPRATAVSFSDGLDKAVVGGTAVGGLSDMAYDARRHAWASTVDNHADDPARIWFWTDPAHAHVVGSPLVLKKPDGTPYDGLTADNEGLAVLPDGEYVVSSETEPSIRIFGRDGVRRVSLPVPARFTVASAGESTANATFEGLTVADGGKRIIASMEGALSGDSDATQHRILTYVKDRHGRYALAKETAYRTEPGNRIAEIQAYGRDSGLGVGGGFHR